jgi:hypothetical protein
MYPIPSPLILLTLKQIKPSPLITIPLKDKILESMSLCVVLDKNVEKLCLGLSRHHSAEGTVLDH